MSSLTYFAFASASTTGSTRPTRTASRRSWPTTGDVIPQVWWHDAYDELEACGHLDPASSKVMGDAHARLSADGRLYLRSASDG